MGWSEGIGGGKDLSPFIFGNSSPKAKPVIFEKMAPVNILVVSIKEVIDSASPSLPFLGYCKRGLPAP